MRAGKIPVITTANAAVAVGTPDNSNFVFLYFDSTDSKLKVKDSTGTIKATAALS